jgi:hypothetical protein
MADYRVWYAARDPYHCIFRLVRLLAAKQEAMPLEQLRVLDMYLMYPSMLSRLPLPSDMKVRYRSLKSADRLEAFVRLPGTASVWQDLQIYQSAALKQLTGLGLLKRDALRDHYASLETKSIPEQIREKVELRNAADKALIKFLVHDIASLPITGKDNLFKRAGLPARGPVL